MNIKEPESAGEFRWIAQSYEETGGLFIQDYKVSATSVEETESSILKRLDSDDHFIRVATGW